MDVLDFRSANAPPITVDLSPIYETIEKWSWLLTEEYMGSRPGYDEFEHDTLCNLSPKYQAGKPPEDVARLKMSGCDRGCLRQWKEQQRLLAIELAEKKSLPRERKAQRKEGDEG
jgi:hypothetical protein